MALRLFHCDDSAGYRRLLRELLDDEPDLELVGEAADAAGAVRGVSAAQPDVVLLDVRLEGAREPPVRELRAAAPGAALVLLTGYAGPMDVAVEARVGKDAPFAEIAETIRRAVST
jgi:DNA-binding NarL/FixJ family response regulator